jgi:hypothetical protein
MSKLFKALPDKPDILEGTDGLDLTVERLAAAKRAELSQADLQFVCEFIAEISRFAITYCLYHGEGSPIGRRDT